MGYNNYSFRGLLLRPPHNPIANPLGYRISPFIGDFFCLEKNSEMILTTILVMWYLLITANDKHICHFEKQACQKEKITCQPSGDGTGGDEMPLHNRLKEYRARIGVNQQEMGRLVDVSRQTISLIERGDYSPSVTLALKIAKVCNATVEDIFEYEEDETNE